ncbi:hypothetical protein [Streptomyces cinereoruber]|uniref:hypothetical protein n=1 Tax=Streptomyces cinereoruber TaxID=67260 RepID=UPI00363D529F
MTKHVDLRAVCDICSTDIGDNEGAIWIDIQEVQTVEREYGDWERRHADGDGTISFDIFSPDSPPGDVRWHVSHDSCLDIPELAYHIPVERLRSWPAYLHWTAHLMEKTWLQHTNWTALIMSTLEGSQQGGGLVPIEKPSADW